MKYEINLSYLVWKKWKDDAFFFAMISFVVGVLKKVEIIKNN